MDTINERSRGPGYERVPYLNTYNLHSFPTLVISSSKLNNDCDSDIL
ncbi:MAG: hypothetical protein RLZZ203_1712 [Cyanobacteriota bacterium]|jgi:hypothetical protein